MNRILKVSFATVPQFISSAELQIGTFQCIDFEGRPLPGAEDFISELSKPTLLAIHRTILQVEEFDSVFHGLQRKGKISFYMENTGEEGLQVASAAALEPNDMIFPQYRELGVLFHRGFSVQQAAHQVYSTKQDLGEGKQMPVHYGSKAHCFQTISSPLGTQIPQASGCGYGFKLRKEPRIAVCYFGDGAASEGDAHAALNFASTLHSQTLFLCRNNQYAISTPVSEQYNGDGIAIRAVAYGIPGLRVDGNDVLATYHATKLCREKILNEGLPVLLECMTYRRGDHSTSDESTRYRAAEEIEFYRTVNNPTVRLEKFLKHAGWLDFDPQELRESLRAEVRAAGKVAEFEELPHWQVLFEGVYDRLTPALQRQRAELQRHLEEYPDDYKLELHAEDK